ncbi:MAG TPA: sugar phosphate isomerase/epimerase [Cytophagales bacterium]|nr:sugar phosphate isomerase/epimerase [Cytophagales bacterium]
MKLNKLLTLLFLFNLILVETQAQSEKPLYTNPLGIQAYTYRNSFPNGIIETLDTIKSLGITEMEGGIPDGMAPDSYRKLLDERNIKVPSTGADYNDLVKNLQEVIKIAKILGASYVMVAWIPHDKTFKFEDAKKATEDFNRVGKILKENGLTFCYHIHGYEFSPYKKGTLFDYIAENTNPEYVSFEMDVLWAFHGGQDPAKLLKKYGKRWKLMHLKDLKKGVKGDFTGSTSTENDVALGTGQIDIPSVLKAAKKIGIKHYFIEDESNRVSLQVPQTIAYLKSLKE